MSHRMCIHVWISVCGGSFPAVAIEDWIFGLQTTYFHPLPCTLSLQLFELLGPEGLEMISTFLQQRGAIVNSLLAIPSDKTGYPPGETA